MSENLKLCPFCGGEAVVVESLGPSLTLSRIVCKNCEAGTASYLFAGDKLHAAWNRRAEGPPRFPTDLEWSLRRALEDETTHRLALEMGIDQARWIPVSERLPEKEGLYLVCGRNKVWVDEWVGPPDKSFVALCPIDAWRPLPEPYEEEK